MEEYRFEHKEPLTQRVVLALRVNTKQLKEQLWLGTEYEVEVALRGLDKPLYLAQTRPLGAFWCEFGETSADGWTEAVWTLLGALSARKAAERTAGERNAAELLSQLVVGNSAALYAAIQIWEMYLRYCRGRDKHKAETALRDYAQLLILPFGEYSPEMANWKREKPVVPVWNHREDAKLELWYPHGEIPFECAVVKRLSAFVSHLLPPADSGCRHGHAYLQPMREGVLRSGYPQQSVQFFFTERNALGEKTGARHHIFPGFGCLWKRH